MRYSRTLVNFGFVGWSGPRAMFMSSTMGSSDVLQGREQPVPRTPVLVSSDGPRGNTLAGRANFPSLGESGAVDRDG